MKNKFPKFLVISLLATFGIVACDDIEARPNADGNSDTTQVISFKDREVFGNTYESINNLIHGTLNDQVLNEILNVYAVNMIAPFNRNAAKIYADKIEINGQPVDGATLLTLEDVVNNNGKIADFVSQYPIYEVLKEDGSHDAAKELEYVKARYASIEDSINKQLFGKLRNAVENYKFDEQEFLRSLFTDGAKVQNPYTLAPGSFTKDLVIVPEIEVEDVFTEVLHKEYYTSDTNTYIEEDILPGIYGQICTQQYILEKQDSLLGSSYARKINYVAVPYGDINNALYAQRLVEGFVTDYLLTDSVTDIHDAFNLLSSVWNGAFMGEDNVTATEEWQLLQTLGLVNTLSVGGIIKQADGKYYIDGSAYGKLVEDYALYDVNPRKSVNTEDYTGSNSYVREIGFEQSRIQISLKDYSSEGWYIKSNDSSNLTTSVQERLYNLLVASGMNNGTTSVLSKDDAGNWTDTETNKFVTKFSYGEGRDAYFLRTGVRKVNEEAFQDIIFNDTGSSTYYIVNIEEAISPNSMKNCTDYDTILAVLDLLSANDTYTNLATKYFLEKCEIKYHDQSVYDYFKENHPELFDDE